MIDLSAIFKNKAFVKDKLLACGFQKQESAGNVLNAESALDTVYTKDYPILDGQYVARVFIREDGKADFRVFDAESGDEYMPAHVYTASGAFVGQIHEACGEILSSIANECYITEFFQWDQAKRILHFIKETYNAEPEFLWKSLPECAALRVPGKKPWFAVVGRIPKEKLGIDEGGQAEVLNLKDEPKAVAARVDGSKAFPAYHMNKQHWYSLMLDDRMTDEDVIALISKSFILVNS